MAKPDHLQLANAHLAVAGRTALDLHRCLLLARAATVEAERRHTLALTIMVHQNTMRQLAAAIGELPEFFRGNLPTSLRQAADQL